MATRPKAASKRSAAPKKRTNTIKKTVRKSTSTKKAVVSKPRSTKLHHRAHHHVKKHIMRYLGGATALFLLTFMSQTGFGQAAQSKVTSSSSKKGYMIIYSQGGKYESAILTTSGYGTSSNNAKRKCSGTTFNVNGVAPLTLSKNPKKISCDATSGTGQYTISYDGGRSVTVDIDAGFCTSVHEDASKITKVAAKNGGCQKVDKTETLVRENAKLNVTSFVAQNNKGITGFVDITASNFKIKRTTCTGQVSIQLKDASGKALKTKNAPIKFTDNKKTAPYCVAKYNFGSIKPGAYSVTASYPGGKFFNATSGTGPTVTVAANTPRPANTISPDRERGTR